MQHPYRGGQIVLIRDKFQLQINDKDGRNMDIERVLNYRPTQQLTQQLTSSFLAPIQEWLLAHPMWHWLFTHPVWLLGLVLLVLFLFVGLLGAIARLTEALWLAILQSPLKLAQWLFVGVLMLLKLPFRPKLVAAPQSATSPDERLSLILNRLEDLRQEQNELLDEVRSILALPQTETRDRLKIER